LAQTGWREGQSPLERIQEKGHAIINSCFDSLTPPGVMVLCKVILEKKMDRLQRTVFRISKKCGQASAIILVIMTVHILVEIILRGFFYTSTYVLDEFVGYGIAAMTFLTLGFALEEGSLIRVNLLLIKLRGPARRRIEIFCVLLTLTIMLFLAKYFWSTVFFRDLNRGAVSESIAQVPMWIPEGLVFLGLIVFIIQLAAYLLRLILGENPIH
jgi:TRAP-type C4-dicarboxylate transport system permease small subunit